MDTLKIVLAGAQETSLIHVDSFLQATTDFTIFRAKTMAEALRLVQTEKIDVAIVAETLADASGLELVKKIVTTNPFINCALESPLDHDDFHEVTEGYGVFTQLPVAPSREDAQNMLNHLNKIYQIAARE